MKIRLDKIELDVSDSLFGKVNVEFNGQVISFKDEAKRVIDIIKENYEKIKTHYVSNFHNKTDINFDDLNTISVKILFNYLDQYSRWKDQYIKSNYDIKFYEKDFAHPSTHDIVILFLKEKYPSNWKYISEKYLDMTTEQFESYWSNRLAYFNK